MALNILIYTKATEWTNEKILPIMLDIAVTSLRISVLNKKSKLINDY